MFSLPQAIEKEAIFAPPNRYFTENSRWVPLVLLLGITVQSESTLHWKLGTSDFGL